MRTSVTVLALAASVILATAGCEEGAPETEKPAATKNAPPATPKSTQAEQPPGGEGMPAGHPSVADPHATAGPSLDGNTLKLDGITLTVPKGWQVGPKPTGPMAAQFAFVLPGAEGDSEAGAVRVSHYPGMRGKDGMNIDRWIAQTTKADGSPSTREDATIESKTIEGGDVTTLSISGSVRATMRSQPLPDAKMIAAIINHERGPHFVVASGPATTMDKWSDSIDAFVDSIDVN